MPALKSPKEQVSVSVDGRLIDALDRYRDSRGFSRSGVISKAIRLYLLTEMDDPRFWDNYYTSMDEMS